jgi:HAD superfamily hydrolase (TIGR01509 family)
MAPLERDERIRMGLAEAVEVGARLPAQVEEVREAFRADERRSRAASLQQCVRRDGRSVRESLDVELVCADGARRRYDRLLLSPSGRHLRRSHLAVRQQHGVRERAADVDAEDRHVRTLHRVPIRALLFDFDGLILDTETASRAGWEFLYREHGHELPQDLWATLVGTVGAPWDPMAHLEELVGGPLDREALHERRRAHELTLLEAEELRPGIADYLARAEELDLKKAIVSSSSRRWVDMHLNRLERAVGWDAIVTADGDHSRAKPQPTLYLEALDVLDVGATQAIAFEDSLHGVRAAQAAGIFCVAVPNLVTADFGLDEADVVVDSLADLPFETLLERTNARTRR